ncbi:hypothetical protein BT93_D1977 [Corymbia citriodora subsp. variegata]|nr:hypothetical protein BT93_D1977 [Corymbia citriodora subsp. variegata]
MASIEKESMSAFVELLQCVLCCEEEDIYDYRQAQRNLGHGGPLLDRIRSAFGLLATHHLPEHEWQPETSRSLLWNTHEPSPLKFTPPSSSSSPCHVVHNPMTRDPIRPKNEPTVTRTVSGLTQSSHVTSPFKAAPSSSSEPYPSVSKPSTASSDQFVSQAKLVVSAQSSLYASKPSTASSSDPFVSPAKPVATSAYLDQHVSRSYQSSNESSSSRLLHLSLSKTSSPNPSPFKAVPSASPKTSPSVSKPSTATSSDPFVSETKPPPISAYSNQNEVKLPRPSNEPSASRVQSPSLSKTTSPTPKAQEHSAKQYKPFLCETVYVRKDTSAIYNIPKDLKVLIKRDIVPGVLKKPLSPSTYRDYFAALIYAEDFYEEKWSGFILKDVTLELHQMTIYKNLWDNDFSRKKVRVTFVKFKMESIPERQPFLLSRDFVFVKPLDKRHTVSVLIIFVRKQGVVYRVEKKSVILAEFGDDFHSQHHSSCRCNGSFSFNRVGLKRAHQAVEAATDPSFHNFLFPKCTSRRDLFTLPSLSSSNDGLDSDLSRTGILVTDALLHIYRHSRDPRILVVAPKNKTCHILLRSLKKKIPDSEIFRANAAFREFNDVPDDVLPSCLYKKKNECFICPPLQELQRFKVIFSTFVSSFRLRNGGINAGHFSHIFLVNASSASEPDTMIVLANLANEDTTVIVTGMQGDCFWRVRSPIAQENGLRISYFERLKEFTPYENLDPAFITRFDRARIR